MGWLDRVLGPGDRDAFAAIVAQEIAKALGVPVPEYDRANFMLRLGPDDEIGLANAWTQAEEMPRRRRAAFARAWVRSLAVSRRYKVPETLDDAIDLLLPKLQARSYFETIDLQQRAQGRPPLRLPHRVVGEHYAVCLVCDFPEICQWVNAEHVAKWGRSFDDLLEFAVGNLRRRSPAAVGRLGDGVRTVLGGDSYDATRLLVLEDALRLAPLSGDLVAIVPHRDALCVAAADDAESLAVLARMAEEWFDRPYALATVPLRREGGEWRPWLPPEGHPAHVALREVARRSVVRDYAEQTAAMRAVYEREQIDVFVATCLIRDDCGRIETIATWSESVDSELPRTEFVMFGRLGPKRVVGADDIELVKVRWEDAARICGARMERTDVFPERWRVATFPDAAEWEQLRAARLS